MYEDERVARFISENFLPALIHARDHREDYKRFGERYGVQWTPTILLLDPGGTERHRIEGFLPADDFLAQLMLGLAQAAFKREEWGDAERRFREVVERFPESDAAPEAQYWAGVARYKGCGNHDDLAAGWAKRRGRYPTSPWRVKQFFMEG